MIEQALSLTSLPSLHPALVHFPIALAVTALIVDLFALAFRRLEWMSLSATMLYVLAAVGSVATYFSGRQAAGTVGMLTAQAEAVLADHADLALLTMWVLILSAVIRFSGAILHQRGKPSAKLVTAAAIIAMVSANVLVAVTADHGGALVYLHGVAVDSGTRGTSDEATEPIASIEPGVENHLSYAEDGSFRWRPSSADGDLLHSVLQTAGGASAEVMKATGSPENGDTGLRIKVSGATVAYLPETFGDVMIAVTVDLRDFEGVFGLGHHIQPAGNGVFFTVTSQGAAGLFRRDAEKDTSMGQGSYEPLAGPITLRTTVAGRHLKGMVGDQTVVHGHGSSGDDGAAGLLFDGHGEVEIKEISVEPIRDH